MQHISTTPFGRRPVSAGLLATQALAQAPAPCPEADKWQVFDALRTARVRFGVTDRDLAVLNALLSFLPERRLQADVDLIVFPSNAALSDRAHGMAESTLRRHLSALVAAGLIARHDSPNGKRYRARDGFGDVAHVFGFSLRPLLVRLPEIEAAAGEARADAARHRLAREAAMLRLRDAEKLAAYAAEEGLAGDWEETAATLADHRRGMRRRLTLVETEARRDAIGAVLEDVAARVGAAEAEKMSGNAAHSERRYQNSNPEPHESEPCKENARAAGAGTTRQEPDAPVHLPIGLVLKACPAILDYAQHPVRHWHELVALAAFVRGMMGISADAWSEAQRILGPEVAAITVAAMLQRVDKIQSPGGYLRALTARGLAGGFSPGPMIMALLSPANRTAA